MRAALHWMMLRVRLYRPDGNGLRRPSDRIEALGVAIALVLFVFALAAAPWVGTTLYQHGQAERNTGRWVTALLTQDAPPGRVTAEDGRPHMWTAATWTALDGREIAGRVPASPAAKAGTAVRVWVNASGQATEHPRERAELIAQGIAAGLAVVLLTGLTLLVLLANLRRGLDRRRHTAWDVAWAIADQRRHRPKQT